jgi:hypothetical protein
VSGYAYLAGVAGAALGITAGEGPWRIEGGVEPATLGFAQFGTTAGTTGPLTSGAYFVPRYDRATIERPLSDVSPPRSLEPAGEIPCCSDRGGAPLALIALDCLARP